MRRTHLDQVHLVQIGSEEYTNKQEKSAGKAPPSGHRCLLHPLPPNEEELQVHSKNLSLRNTFGSHLSYSPRSPSFSPPFPLSFFPSTIRVPPFFCSSFPAPRLTPPERQLRVPASSTPMLSSFALPFFLLAAIFPSLRYHSPPRPSSSLRLTAVSSSGPSFPPSTVPPLPRASLPSSSSLLPAVHRLLPAAVIPYFRPARETHPFFDTSPIPRTWLPGLRSVASIPVSGRRVGLR